MPFDKVMPKFKSGQLHSGSKQGPQVTNPKQAVAILLSEKEKAQNGDQEYAAKGGHARPSGKKSKNPALSGLRAAKPKSNDPDNDGDGGSGGY